MSEVSTQTLHIVARELNNELNEARAALENFGEQQEDGRFLETCRDRLHSVNGALRVAEVYGAALLAEEMEQLSKYLITNLAEKRHLAEGLDALMRAMVQLPTYLERVLNGGRDMALVLLPLLNDLRAVRGHALLSEGTLLLLNLTSEKQANPQPPAPGEVAMPVSQWARKLRTRFQLGLLGWIKGERVEQNLDALARAAEKIEQVATTQCVFQLWWVVGAVIEALRDQGLEGGASVKRLLGQSDREMRRLYEQGEERYCDRPPVELLNNLLYYLARATSNGARVSAVRASFRLGELLPVDSNVEAARESLAAPSVKLMKTVASAIKEDLAHVKDALDIFVRQGGTQATELAPQLELLRKIGDTLGVLGLGDLRDKVQTEVAELQGAVQKQARIDETLLMRMAGTLIKIEDGLDSELVGLILPGAETTAAPTGGDVEFRQVSEAVLRECIVNMARVKEAIALSVEKPREPQVLDQVPTLVSGIVSGLLMLGKTRAVEIAKSIGKALTNHVRTDGTHSSQEAMERLADAIVAVEYYMETIQAGRADPWYMLDNAEACLTALAEMSTGSTGGMRSLRELDDHSATMVDVGASTLAMTHQRTTLLTATQQATQVIPTQQSAQVAAAAAAQAAAQKAQATSDTAMRKGLPPVLQPPPDKADPEFLELFIEEARDEIAKLQRLFPLWDDNPQDMEALTNMRRSFHTLKGSGRMVGAKLIGEFAWSIENMLNRVINKTLDRTPDMMLVMRRAVAAVPELVEQLESGRPTQIDVGALISETNGIAMLREAPARTASSDTARVAIPKMSEAVKFEPPSFDPPRAAPKAVRDDAPLPTPKIATTPPPRVTSSYADTPSSMDPALHEIFSKETAGHLAAIREYMASCALLAPPYPVTEGLHRACHTLSGTAKTAGARQGIKIAEPLNHYIRKLYDNAFGLPAAGLQVLKDSVRAIETVVEHINESTGYFVTHTSIIERIAKLERSLDDELTAMTAAVDATAITRLPGIIDVPSPLDENDTVRRPVVSAPAPSPDDSEIVELSFEASGEDDSLGISSPTQLSPMLKFTDTQKISTTGTQTQIAQPAYSPDPPPTLNEPLEGNVTQRLSPSGPPQSIVETAPWAAKYEPPVLAPLKAEASSDTIYDIPQAKTVEVPTVNPDDEHAETRIEIALDSVGTPSLREPETISIMIPPRDAAAPAPQRTVPQSAPLRVVPPPAPVAAIEATNSFMVPAAEIPDSDDEEWDPDVAAIFTEEATELLDVADAALASWVRDRKNQTLLFELKRALHTIKGGARMAGIRSMGDLSHELETFIEGVENGRTPVEQPAIDALQASLDELHRMRDSVSKGQKIASARELIGRIRALGGHAPAAEAAQVAAPAPVAKAAASVSTAPPPKPAQIVSAPPIPAAPSAPPVVELISIPDVVAAHDEADADISADFRANDLPSAPPQHEPVVEFEADMSPPEEIVIEDVQVDVAEARAEAAPQSIAALPPGRDQQQQERQEMTRVDAELLDTLLNNAGEVSIFRSRLEQQVNSIEFNLAELARTVTRLKDQLRKLELETEAQILHKHQDEKSGRADFDPLELDRYSSIQQLSRALAESVSDVASIEGLLENMAREAQNLLLQQSRVVTEVQNGLMKTRMVPFQRHVQRLSRIVRQVAAETGKRADLVVTGASGELDRQVLERMLPPFEHMLRNSVVHGIETPEERRNAGKSESGTIKIGLHREGSEMVIVVEDDGRGIDVKAVRERAAQRGLLKPGRTLTDEEALQLVLEPGFSTASKVTQHAGRGVGMDVVVAEIKKLGGALFTASTPGLGVRFTIRLPFTLAISQALIVRVGDEQYALPLATVEGVARVERADVIKHLREEIPTYSYGNQIYRFQHLGSFIGAPPSTLPDADVAIPVMLIRAGELSAGLVVDELVGNREIVVKSVGPQVSGIRGIAGATILGDGRIVVILDMGALVRSEWREGATVSAPLEDRRTLALVVDDSITVRRVTQRLLERNGMRVLTAKDGVEALEIMQEHLPDVVLLDIEMPRMDGYELAGQMRNDEKLTEVPIIMITSRVGEKHRARAIELGVNDYLGKPYQENQLLDAIEPLVAARRRKQAMAR